MVEGYTDWTQYMSILPNSNNPQRAFTLLELLVVISIIGLLATVIIGSVNVARMKARDAERIKTVQEMRKAIELYYSDYGYYPPLTTSPANDARSGGGTVACSDGVMGTVNWCVLITAIAPYYKGGKGDPLNANPNYYYYDADGTTPAYYGLMAMLESSSNDGLVQNDGGFYCTAGACTSPNRGIEFGNEPIYCMENGWGDWRVGGTRRCNSASSPTPP